MDKSRYLSPREYEMLTILLPDQGEDETKAAIEKMLSYITDEQGTIDSVAADSPWGRRRLAYTVRHEGVDYRDGHYVLVYFTAMPSAISEIERELKLDTNVIRYLLLTQDPHMGEKIDPAALAEAAAAEAAAAEATSSPEAEADEAPAPDTAESEAPVAETVAASDTESADADVAEVAEVEETVVEENTTEEPAAEGDAEEATEE